LSELAHGILFSQSAILTAMSFQPKDANFEGRVRASFAQQSAMRTLGVEIVRLIAPAKGERFIFRANDRHTFRGFRKFNTMKLRRSVGLVLRGGHCYGSIQSERGSLTHEHRSFF